MSIYFLLLCNRIKDDVINHYHYIFVSIGHGHRAYSFVAARRRCGLELRSGGSLAHRAGFLRHAGLTHGAQAEQQECRSGCSAQPRPVSQAGLVLRLRKERPLLGAAFPSAQDRMVWASALQLQGDDASHDAWQSAFTKRILVRVAFVCPIAPALVSERDAVPLAGASAPGAVPRAGSAGSAKQWLPVGSGSALPRGPAAAPAAHRPGARRAFRASAA